MCVKVSANVNFFVKSDVFSHLVAFLAWSQSSSHLYNGSSLIAHSLNSPVKTAEATWRAIQILHLHLHCDVTNHHV